MSGALYGVAPACPTCRGPMRKAKVSSGNFVGIVLALIVFVVGLAVTILIPLLGWDAGPPVMNQFSWPELIAFDQWLRVGRNKDLVAKTKEALSNEVATSRLGDWYLYQLEQYQHSVETMLKGFAAAGKKLLITSQRCPLVPPSMRR